MTEKIRICFYKAFFLLFTMMMVLGMYYIIKANYSRYNAMYFIIAILSVVLFIYFVNFIVVHIENIGKKQEIILVFAIMGVAFLLRWIFIVILKTVPVSDFDNVNIVYENMKNSGEMSKWYEEYYARFPSWFPYMKLVSWFYNVFCHGCINYEALKYVNSLLNVLTVAIVYYIVRQIGTIRAACISAILYACSPSLIIYASVETPDHITMLLMGIELIVWDKLMKNKNNFKNYLFICFLFSFICLLINWFKPVSILFLMVFLCFEIITKEKRMEEDKKKSLFYRIYRVLTFCLIFIFVTKTGNLILNTTVERYTNQQVVDATWLYIYAGLEMNEDGSAASTNYHVEELQSQFTDQGEMVQEAKKLSIIELKKNINKIPKLLFSKYSSFIESEGNYWYWANTNENNGYKNMVDEVLGVMFFFLSNIYMLGIVFFMMMLGILQLFSKETRTELSPVALTIFGYFLILVLGVQQARYKSIVMPQICILAAFGMSEIQEKLKKSNLRENNEECYSTFKN